MCDEIIGEQEIMLRYELDRFKEGVFAFCFFSTDRIQHVFWGATDPLHPLYNGVYAKKYGNVIRDYYVKMDNILGEVIRHIDDKTAIMIFSDHGFTSFRRAVHLNTWLAENGYMKLHHKADGNDGGALFRYVDWKNTYAYALGFGSIYLNLKGRERDGIIDKDKTHTVVKELSERLAKMTDTKGGHSVVRNVYRGDMIYSGKEIDKSPDIVVGFQDGYRASWQTAIGGAPSMVFEDNLYKWSGDHIVDPSVVPGVLFTNLKINSKAPTLTDIAPTVLSCFGLQSTEMEGKSLIT
jgi:predicted AlkP superfamily phosphohydrolase/phosphomutase